MIPGVYTADDYNHWWGEQTARSRQVVDISRPSLGGTLLVGGMLAAAFYFLPGRAKGYFLAAFVAGAIGFYTAQPLWGWICLALVVMTIGSAIAALVSSRPAAPQPPAVKRGSNTPWTPEAEAWAAAYAARSQPEQRHTKHSRTVTVTSRPPEAAQRPVETFNDVAHPSHPQLILPRYSGPRRPCRHGEDHGAFTIDDHRRFDPDLEG